MAKKTKQEKELEYLSQEEEIYDLDVLILEGKDTKIDITVDFPTKNGIKKVGAQIRPVTIEEWNKSVLTFKRKKTDLTNLILSKCLFKRDGSEFPKDLISSMPGGVADNIFKLICKVSGIKQDEAEQKELVKELVGF